MKTFSKRAGLCLLICLLAFAAVRPAQGAAAPWINWRPADVKLTPALYEQVDEILGAEDRPQQRAALLHDWICAELYYDRDAQTLETYGALSASDVLEQRRGVCEAIANVTQSLFLAAEIPCVKVWGVAIAPEEDWKTAEIDLSRVNHTWNEYYIAGQWIPVDCTMDMGNWYENGVCHAAPWTRAYLAPPRELFARTHIKLYQDTATQADTPDLWAREELIQAVDAGIIPVMLLSDYKRAITGLEFFQLTGQAAGEGPSVSRAAAAVALMRRLDPAWSGGEEEERLALEALSQMGILLGDGESQAAWRELTRQEAMVLMARLARWEAGN